MVSMVHVRNPFTTPSHIETAENTRLLSTINGKLLEQGVETVIDVVDAGAVNRGGSGTIFKHWCMYIC